MWSQLVSTGCNDKLLNEIGLEIGFSEHYDLFFTPLPTNTFSKLKVQKLYWYAGYCQSQQ